MHDGPSQSTSRAASLPRGMSPRFLPDHFPHLDSTTLSSKQSTSFTTSLDIAVEGATPIYTDYHNEPVPHVVGTPQQVSPSINKRAPRKSKTEALAALHTHARSSSLGPDDPGYQESESHFSAAQPPIPVPPTLDLSSVKTCSPRMLPPRPNPRPFDLEDCPTFYPTMEEFKDALAYIRSISDRAVKFGMCKIVPPTEWTMPFVTDTQVSRVR
jgi:histone demethylase JARID1